MRKLLVINLIVALFAAVPLDAYDPVSKSLIERKGGGVINWSSGVIEASGAAKIPTEDGSNPHGNSPRAISAAIKDARRNLLKNLKNIRVDTSKRVIDVARHNGSIMIQLESMVYDAPEIEQLRKYQPDGSINVQLVLSLRGGFAQLILPKEIRQIEAIRQVSNGKKSSDSTAPGAPVADVYTAIVVDARGILSEPALAPKLFDENSQEVFGPAFASREFAVQEGTVTYTTDIWNAKNDPRVGDNPLVVKALRTQWPGLCDFVIKNIDATKLRSASEHLTFLRECRVIIILDPM